MPPVQVDSSGSASGSGEPSASGEPSGDLPVSGSSGDGSASGLDVAFNKCTTVSSGDQSSSGGPQEGITAIFTSGDLGSASGLGPGPGRSPGSGSGEAIDSQHSGFLTSGSGHQISGTGYGSGSGRDREVVLVDEKMVELSRTPQEQGQELGSGGINVSGGYTVLSGSGSGDTPVSGSSGFSHISLVDSKGIDMTTGVPREQELSGFGLFGSFHSGLPSGGSGSGLASGNPFQVRGVVEVSGSGIQLESSSPLDVSGSSGPDMVTYSEYGATPSPSGFWEDDRQVLSVTPEPAYSSLTTAPSVPLVTPGVVESPDVEEGTCELFMLLTS